MNRADNGLTGSTWNGDALSMYWLRYRSLQRMSFMHETDLQTNIALEEETHETARNRAALGIGRDVRRSRDWRTPDRRSVSGRRRVHRPRRRIRTLLLVAAAAGIPIAIKGPAVFSIFPGVTVGVSNMRTVPADRAYDDVIRDAARTYGINEDLIRAVIRAESSFDPLQVSPAGAKGLMQIMPVLAKELGVSDPFDPRENVMAGTRYLRRLLDAHSGNVALALASYNAGPTAVRRYKGVPPYRETRKYLRKIKGYLAEAETADAD